MKKTIDELLNDKEKVLVNRGDMYMLLHSVAMFFYQNGKSEEWVGSVMGSFFMSNHFGRSFADGFREFMDAYNADEEENAAKYEAMEKAEEYGFDSVDDFIDYMNGGGLKS